MTEAMSYGLPVIAYRSCCSIAAMIEDGASGLLAEDTPESLAKAMDRMIEHQEMRVRLGANARQAMRQYAPEIIWNQWDDVLDEVLRERGLCS